MGKVKKKIYDPNSMAFRLSMSLLIRIIERKTDYKRPNNQKWCFHIDRMIRLDNRKPETIQEVIEWCQQDDFWQNNILSTDKLRKHFDRLELQMGKSSKETFQQRVERVSKKNHTAEETHTNLRIDGKEIDMTPR